MQNLRRYGSRPFRVVVVHGGPGAAGEMAPVARELASERGVLEPLQAAASVSGQIDELRAVLETSADLPVTLIGFSWGAWLSYLCSAYHPALVQKLILVSSGPFEERYAAGIQTTRLSRLSESERVEMHALVEAMKDPTIPDKDALLARFGQLFTKADACDPAPLESEEPKVCWDIHARVWQEAAQWRGSGKLLALAERIACPVLAIHGDYDPHPAEGVREPLTRALRDFKLILLKHCGHKPWIEKQAADLFYKVLTDALS
ncbi:MAG: alpha/beta hydrolase [Phycisphaerales bacterium]|nr:MAG: alpha/beta hydrolase [Phycisphaerales bacterium]